MNEQDTPFFAPAPVPPPQRTVPVSELVRRVQVEATKTATSPRPSPPRAESEKKEPKRSQKTLL